MESFRFAYPFVLILFFLPPAVYFVSRLHQWRPRNSTFRYPDIRLMDNLPVGWRVRLRWLPDGLRWLAWIFLVISLARPQVGNATEFIRGQGVDIVMAVDISNSMGAVDFEPQNRLEASKAVIADFISGREFDRIGLVVFAREAFHQVPLTLDYDVLIGLLEQVRLVNDIVDSDGIPLLLDGTAIGLGVASSANMLRGGESDSRVIILLTDGANNSALDPLQASEAAQAFGIRIYSIGVGREGLVDIPDRNGGVVTIESDLNESMLQEMSQITGGQYFRAQDLDDLQAIYDEIDGLEPSNVELQVITRWQDRVFVFLMGGLALLLVERVLRQVIFGELL